MDKSQVNLGGTFVRLHVDSVNSVLQCVSAIIIQLTYTRAFGDVR